MPISMNHSGKGVFSASLPVEIYCDDSTIGQRLAIDDLTIRLTVLDVSLYNRRAYPTLNALYHRIKESQRIVCCY